jgi:hypothetical protein
MRYNYDFFTEFILKHGSIILPYNMNILYLCNGSK